MATLTWDELFRLEEEVKHLRKENATLRGALRVGIQLMRQSGGPGVASMHEYVQQYSPLLPDHGW